MKLVTIGEILVEFVSHERNCALEKITEYSGPYPSGAPAIFLNQATIMGAVTEMIGGVGSDAFGRSVLNRLRHDGVGVDGVKISKGLRILLFIGLIIFAILFAIGGKFLLTLPLTIASLALLKLKGLSLFQLISLFRLIQTLRNSGRFSFKNKNVSSTSSMSTSEAYKILNLNPAQSLTKEKVNRAYIKIQKKIHPDISPETARLSSIVNEAKEIVLSDIS